jgi:hypothetical protein
MDTQLSTPVEARAAGRPQLAPHVDPAAVAPYLCRYTHPTLGEMTIALKLVQDVEGVRKKRSAAAKRGLEDPPR